MSGILVALINNAVPVGCMIIAIIAMIIAIIASIQGRWDLAGCFVLAAFLVSIILD